MCKLKNDRVTGLLSRLRSVEKDGVSSLDNQALATDIAELYYVSKELEKYQDLLEAAAVERKLPMTQIPDLELNVQVKAGNNLKTVNLASIFEWFKGKRRTDDFLSCVNFVQSLAASSLAKDDAAWKVINEATEVKLSEKLIASVSKMTKQELKEANLRK
jgi:hypothetical protein